jgi:hypothetical protein
MPDKSRVTVKAAPSKDASKVTACHIHRDWLTGPGKTDSDTFDVGPDQAITIYDDGCSRGPHIRYDNVSVVPASRPAGKLDFKHARPDWGGNGHGTRFTLVTEEGRIPLEMGSVFTTDANTQVDTQMLGVSSRPTNAGKDSPSRIGTSASDDKELNEIKQALKLKGSFLSWTTNDKGHKDEWEDCKLGPNETFQVYHHPRLGRILLCAPPSEEPPSIDAASILKHGPGRLPIPLAPHDKIMVSIPGTERTFGPSSELAFVTDDKVNVEFPDGVLKPLIQASPVSSVAPASTNDGSKPPPISCGSVTTLGSKRPFYLGS